MLCWDWDRHEPTEFLIVVPNDQRLPDFSLSKIKVWNYNRSLMVRT